MSDCSADDDSGTTGQGTFRGSARAAVSFQRNGTPRSDFPELRTQPSYRTPFVIDIISS